MDFREDPGMTHGFVPFPGAKVLDIGANVGRWSAYCAANGANVLAFEPDPETFLVLASLIQKEKFSISAINAAVWTHTGCVHFRGFTRGENHNGALSHVQCPDNGLFRDKETVRCVSFRDAVGDQTWDCVKVDVEGSEYEMLLGATVEDFEKIKFLYVEFHPWWVATGLHERLVDHLSRFFVVSGLEENYAMCKR